MNKLIKIIVLIVMIVIMMTVTVQGEKIRGINGKKIVIMDKTGESLGAKIRSLNKIAAGAYFLAGYEFDARNRSHSSGIYSGTKKERTSFISRKGDRLVVNHYGAWKEGKKSEAVRPAPRKLIYLYKKEAKRFEVVDVSALNFGAIYEINNLPLYWFGKAKTTESIAHLKKLFSTGKGKLPKRLLPAIALHNHPSTLEFLYKVSQGGREVGLRENAVFWMGAVHDDEAIPYLNKIAAREKETTVRKQVIFAFYLLGSKKADQELVKMAKKEPSSSIRKKAIFWLGQRASKESVKALKEIITSDEELSVKSSAVFAVSQLKNDQAVPLLIDIAKTHKSAKIRKKAIFWLGETGDPRAITFFEKILLK